MERILLKSNCGRAEQDTNYQHVLIGTNSRLSEFQSICNTIFSQVLYYVVEAGEERKSLENAQKIYMFLVKHEIYRTDVLFTLGEGVIGAFYQPKLVYINYNLLKSLPLEELRNGFVEILVHAIIKDETLFQFIEENMAHIFQLKENLLEELIYQDCKIKGEVVQKDEKDLGERAILNFGHTFGHAVESAYDYQYRHGQFVAHGILGVCRIVERLGLVSAIETKRI